MEMTSIKTIAVFMIIFGCFAVLYPKIFHPMVMQVVSYGNNQQTTEDLINSRISPHLKKPGKTIPAADDITRHMRAGPHPGMRAAAEMKKQAAAQGTGGGKGMMSIVLPMYAVGIVLYLIYTMTKVFGGKSNPADKDFLSTHFSDVQYDPDRQKFTSTLHRQETENDGDEANISRRFKKGRRDLERLLLKADKNNISTSEMHELKRRLLETEAQMSRILGAMESVQQCTEQVIKEVPREAGDGEEEDGGWVEEDEEDREEIEEIEVEKRTPDLSPDMDSYEFVKGQSPELSPGGSSPDVEVLSAHLTSPASQDSEDIENVENNSADISENSDVSDDIPHKHAKCRQEISDEESDEASVEEPVEEVLIEDNAQSSSDEEHPDLRKRLPRDKELR